MTLIICRQIKEKIYIVSDSKVTDKNAVRNNPLTGNLKSIILNPYLSLCFAGNIHYAEKILELFYSNKIANLQQLVLECLKTNIESNNETDFIIASLENGNPIIIKVSNKTAQQNQQNAWIGNQTAFSKFQKHYHSSESDKQESSKINNAFKSVIENEEIEDVADFCLSIETVYQKNIKKYCFIYEMSAEVSFRPGTIIVSKENQIIPFGGAEKGAFLALYMRSFNLLKPAIAIHFPEGKFGVLFCPAINLNKAEIIKEANGEKFMDIIYDKYGINLEGLVAEDGNRLTMKMNEKNLP
ncbi:hypothetical protein [Tenacibaculum finnmarkense]|uniref:hypothetical protein n=1 Tax=Tenacibaculum finnmarkense TaxID=2781243 RepID=UPI00187B5C64|nr:hypothetical protein [Tenacibaculum finnmarkense]MBE7692825.1 hypothetical protein [Tenacibaculum finnmarkense genomovar finnmarkense]